MTTASCPAARAWVSAACTEVIWPAAHAGFSSRVTPSGSASGTDPVTTTTSSKPAASAWSTAHSYTARPCNGASSLWLGPEKRVPPPAASRTAAVVTGPSSVRPREPEDVLGEVGEHELLADRG